MGQATPSHAVAGKAFEHAHSTLLGRTDLQFDFPTFVQPKPPAWLEALARLLVGLLPILKWVFWGAVALAALLIVYFLGRELLRLRLPTRIIRDKPKDMREEWRPTAEQARILLEDADRLAAEGRFAEAVHLLLLRSVQDIADKRPRLLRPALTSREIGSLDALPPSARAAFTEIARVVELNRFGGRAVTAQDFARCRSDYEKFAFPDTWQDRHDRAA
ncbi:MAG TPA: DUF4129 domain-containing protein [Rhizomicrobium sp.]|nr:DUF4129 domain-containing protein [Rhizomicrobium sp.]